MKSAKSRTTEDKRIEDKSLNFKSKSRLNPFVKPAPGPFHLAGEDINNPLLSTSVSGLM